MKKSFILLILMVSCSAANAQMLRYYQRREIKPPEYATLRLGPFYSNLSFEQRAGFRYTESEGTGTDFLFGNERGIIKEDGEEYPLVSRLNARNYLMISRNMDLDISFSLGYAHFPLETQEDEFFFDIAEEGASGSLSMEFYITKYVRGRISDDIVYRTDYIDLRGIDDNFGGSAYEHLENDLELTADWLMDETKNLGFEFSRVDLIVMSEDFEDLEHTTFDEAVYYEHQLTAFLVVGGRTAFGQTYYESDGRSDSTMQSYSAYASAQLTDRTDAGLSVGYSLGSSEGVGSVGSVISSGTLSTRLTREVMHGIVLQRSLSAGFRTPFSISSAFTYTLTYQRERASLSFVTGYSTVEPEGDTFNKYSDWTTAMDLSLPVTRFVNVLCSAQYAVRNNEEVGGSQLTDPEYTSNYDTLSARLGTRFSVTSSIDFDVYAQHINRSSDNPDLEYSRDIFAGTFTYSHAF